jgi:MFS family permease
VTILIRFLFGRERGKFYGIVGMVWALAFTLGPLIGGAFTKGVTWRWCFYVNLPISGTSFTIIAFMLKLETTKTPLMAGIKAIDWVGTVALVGGLLMFLLGLVFGGTVYAWNSATVICLIIFGIVTLGIFIMIEWYMAKYPIIPVHIYANISNFAIFLVNLIHGICFTANIYFLPLYAQAVLGASPLISGVLLLPFAAALSVGSIGAGVYMKKTGRFLDCIRLGFVVLILGLGLNYDLPDSRYWPKVILYQIISGFGIGLLFQPPMIALQNSISPQHNAAATASFALVRNVASAIGVVIGSVAFSNRMDAQQASLSAALGPTTASLFSGSNAQANVLFINTLSALDQQIVVEAFWLSIRDIWLVTVCIAALGLFVCLLIKRKELGRQHVEVKTGLVGEEERRRLAMQERMAQRQTDPESGIKEKAEVPVSNGNAIVE